MKVKSYGMGISVTHLTAAVGWLLVFTGLLSFILIGLSEEKTIIQLYQFGAACTGIVSGFSIILFSLLTRSNLENAEMTSEILQILNSHANQVILANVKPSVHQELTNESDSVDIKEDSQKSIKELVDVKGKQMYKEIAIIRTSDGYRAYGKEFEDFKDVLDFIDQVTS